MKVKELRAKAKELGIKGYSEMKKDELQAAIDKTAASVQPSPTHPDRFNDPPFKSEVETEEPESDLEAKVEEARGADQAEMAKDATFGQDRQMRYRRNPICPDCGTHPTVCTSRRPMESTHRCRVCGARWAVVQKKEA